MFTLVLVSGLILGYLSGSVSYARLFARIGKGVDITEVGNGNPGTSNVSREVGVVWGVLTLIFDALKGSMIMLLYKWLFFSADPVWHVSIPFHGAEFLAILLIGIAAIYGHAFPVFHQFKGGGSIGVLFGCWMFLIFPQFLINIAIAYLIVKIFFRKQKYPMGRMTPFVFLFTTPVYMLVESLVSKEWNPLFSNSVIFDHLGWGDHFVLFNGNGWMLIAGLLVFGLAVIPPNMRLLKSKEILASSE